MAQEIKARLSLDSTQFTKSVDDAFGSVKRLTGVVGTLVGIGSIGAIFKEALRAADEIDAISKKLGISTDEVQRLKFAAEQSGTGFDQLAKAAMRAQRAAGSLQNNTGLLELTEDGAAAEVSVGKLASALDTLKISQGAFISMSASDKVLAVADAMREASFNAASLDAAFVVLGKGAAELLPLFKENREALKKMFADAPVASAQSVADAKLVGDAFNEMWNDITKASIGAVAVLYRSLQTTRSIGTLMQAELARAWNTKGPVSASQGTPAQLEYLREIDSILKDFPGSYLFPAMESEDAVKPAPVADPALQAAQRKALEEISKIEKQRADAVRDTQTQYDLLTEKIIELTRRQQQAQDALDKTSKGSPQAQDARARRDVLQADKMKAAAERDKLGEKISTANQQAAEKLRKVQQEGAAIGLDAEGKILALIGERAAIAEKIAAATNAADRLSLQADAQSKQNALDELLIKQRQAALESQNRAESIRAQSELNGATDEQKVDILRKRRQAVESQLAALPEDSGQGTPQDAVLEAKRLKLQEQLAQAQADETDAQRRSDAETVAAQERLSQIVSRNALNRMSNEERINALYEIRDELNSKAAVAAISGGPAAYDLMAKAQQVQSEIDALKASSATRTPEARRPDADQFARMGLFSGNGNNALSTHMQRVSESTSRAAVLLANGIVVTIKGGMVGAIVPKAVPGATSSGVPASPSAPAPAPAPYDPEADRAKLKELTDQAMALKLALYDDQPTLDSPSISQREQNRILEDRKWDQKTLALEQASSNPDPILVDVLQKRISDASVIAQKPVTATAESAARDARDMQYDKNLKQRIEIERRLAVFSASSSTSPALAPMPATPPIATPALNTKGLGSIGAAGGGAVDFMQKTASHTAELVKLVASGLKINSMPQSVAVAG